jgi:DNA-binding transcriptional LysR family regulator
LLEVHAQAQAALHGPSLSGRVTMGVPDDYAAAYLTPVLRSFATRHAGVEITLVCEQSTALLPKISRGEIDLALVSRDRAKRGKLLFREPLVWVGAPQHEVWRRDPLPIAAYEFGSLVRREALAALAAQRRAYRVVYNSASLAGQLAAVESGLAVAVLTRCSVPSGLLQLQGKHGLPELPSVEHFAKADLRRRPAVSHRRVPSSRAARPVSARRTPRISPTSSCKPGGRWRSSCTRRLPVPSGPGP